MLVFELGDPSLCGRHLELALAHVGEVLRRAHDQIDDGPDEREQRGRGGARDQHRIGDPPARVAVGPVDQRQPDHNQEQQKQVHGQCQPAVFNAEHGNQAH